MQSPLRGLEVLLIEDEPLWRRELSEFLEDEGAEVTVAQSLEEVRHCLAQAAFDVVLADVHLPDGRSLDLLREGSLTAALGVVVMTGEGGIETAVEAMRLGARDYLSKPFEPEELALVVARLRRVRQSERLDTHRRGQERATAGGFFFGRSLSALRGQLERILEADRRLGTALPPILLQGETGTGKTSLARWIHEQGPRSSGPWVEINCAALPETLAESELFGHEKGSFTDARQDRLGLFEAAHGGTLFLDEIGSLALPIQAKILTAIEQREVRRVGGRRPREVDVRLIAASLEDLPAAVRSGRFRDDLLHRLNLLALRLPPLRERGDDVLELATFLLDRLKQRYRRPAVQLHASAQDYLRRHAWPGNLRELAHELERALIFGEEDVLRLGAASGAPSAAEGDAGENRSTLRDPAWRLPESGFILPDALRALENELIEEALTAAGGNVSGAARRLGVARDYLRYRQRTEPH
ncbi:MAG: sigma-54-dependent transcriptional regulator [Verrucomicrobiota bacterium]